MHYWATVLLLLTALGTSTLTERRIPETLVAPMDTISPHIAGWAQASREQSLSAAVLRSIKPTSYLSRVYAKNGSQLDLLLVFYAQQRGGESMHSPKACLPGGGWEIWKQDSALIPIHGAPTRINKFSIQNSGQRLLVFYWYQSKRRVFANEFLGKLLLVKDTLLSGRTAGGLVRITLADQPGMAEEGLSFASSIAPQIERCFRE